MSSGSSYVSTIFTADQIPDNSEFIWLGLSLIVPVALVLYGILQAISPTPIESLNEELFYTSPHTSSSSWVSKASAVATNGIQSTSSTENVGPYPLPHLREPATKALSVVIPAFNESLRLRPMLDEVFAYLASEEGVKMLEIINSKSEEEVKGWEVILVDDGSKDKGATVDVAMKVGKEWDKSLTSSSSMGRRGDASRNSLKGIEVEGEMRVVKLSLNRGKGGAVQHGVMHARGSAILFVDADGASKFSDLGALVTALPPKDRIPAGHGISIGSRAHMVSTEAVVKRSLLRNLLMHGFHLFVKTVGVKGIKDTQCGFKSALVLFPSLHLRRWSFDVELLLLASLTSPAIPVEEVPITWHEVEGSKISLGWDSLGMARDLIVLRLNLLLGGWAVPAMDSVGDDKKVKKE